MMLLSCFRKRVSGSLSGSLGSRSILEMTLGSSEGLRCAGSGGSVPWIKDVDKVYDAVQINFVKDCVI